MVLAPHRYVSTYLLENLSTAGALLVGDAKLTQGDRVQLLLRLQHDRGRRLSVQAVVIRRAIRGRDSVFAVKFTQLSAAAEDVLQEAVSRGLQRARASSVVLVIGEAPDIAEGLVHDLQDLPREPFVVTTVLDAITWLQASDVSVEAAIVDADLGEIDALSLLELIAVDYPEVRRILTCNRDRPDFQHAVIVGQAHALLPRPWDRASLERALEQKNRRSGSDEEES